MAQRGLVYYLLQFILLSPNEVKSWKKNTNMFSQICERFRVGQLASKNQQTCCSGYAARSPHSQASWMAMGLVVRRSKFVITDVRIIIFQARALSLIYKQ